MKDRVLLPWTTNYSSHCCYWRRSLGDKYVAIVERWKFIWVYDDANRQKLWGARFTAKSAMYACDEKLLSLGYEFVDDDRAEKLRLLL